MHSSTDGSRDRAGRMSRRILVFGVLGVLGGLAAVVGCGALRTPWDATQVLDTGVEPVELAYPGPTYAVGTRDGLVLRAGQHRVVVPTGRDAAWLPNGTAVVSHDRSRRVVAERQGRDSVVIIDPAAGSAGTGIGGSDADLPSRSVSQINVWEGYDRTDASSVSAYDMDGQELWTLSFPATDNPDASADNELERNYYGATPTIDDVTFNLWHDSSESYEDGDYGVLRVEDGDMTNVALNERLVALYLSADGSGLLALRQVRGDPCGGCKVEQEIVELDHRTGELVRYGTPDDYDEEWRVAAMDKVGDRVAVQFTETEWIEDADEPGLEVPTTVQRGTWVFEDGDWSMIEGSETELTWWQGEHRVVARLVDDEPVTRNNTQLRDGFDLFWVRPDGTEEPVAGELLADYGRRFFNGQVAGQLLPPQ